MLVVRVKRYRYDEPAEELCVFEDTAPLHKKKKSGITTQLSRLATGATSRPEPATFTSTAYCLDKLVDAISLIVPAQELQQQEDVHLHFDHVVARNWKLSPYLRFASR